MKGYKKQLNYFKTTLLGFSANLSITLPMSIAFVKTFSWLTRSERVSVWFSDKDGNEAGGVYIDFYKQIDYVIGWCTLGIPFPGTLPTETQKTWTLKYNTAEQRVYYCNGVQVADVVLSDSACTKSSWRKYWERKPTPLHRYILFPSVPRQLIPGQN